jgi:hypothetical protein
MEHNVEVARERVRRYLQGLLDQELIAGFELLPHDPSRPLDVPYMIQMRHPTPILELTVEI